MAVVLTLCGIGGFLAMALVAPFLPRARVSLVTSATIATICTALLVGAAGHLLSDNGMPLLLTLAAGVPGIGAHFRLDALAAFFLLVVNLGGAVASLYAIGYGAHEREPMRVLPFQAAFLAGMNLAVVADDAYSFLVGWEFMSLSSWALVISQHRDAENRRAGFIYIAMASFGAIALLLAFALLAGSAGSATFGALRAASPPAGLAGAVVVLAFLGAGSKAGLAPLHVWLPLAHPAAPSHVSALMSGVMTKVAVYAFIRIVFEFSGIPAVWWSVLAIGLGGATALLGVLHAIFESDLKKLLAYSTVENIGIIFAGLGLALAFRANGFEAAAALAFTATLFHALNHSLFKTLLFLGAGAVLTATGTRSLEKLGGLIHRMPGTAVVMLGGCMAISALPPMNGFASEWLMFQAILVSPILPQWSLKLLVPAVGAALALTAALSAACFVRAYGIGFLGRARSPEAETCRETDRWSLASMSVLLALCILAGVLPGPVLDVLSPVSLSTVGARMPVQSGLDWLSVVPIHEGRSSYNGLLVFLFIGSSAVLAWQVILRLAHGGTRRGPAWDCGFPDASPSSQYTASSFAQPIRRVFGPLVFAAREHVDMPAPGEVRNARIVLVARDRIWDGLYVPLSKIVALVSARVDRVHYLTIRGYLGLVFVTLVGLLLGVAVWP